MRYRMILFATFCCLAANSLVYSQNGSAGSSSKQLLSSWARTDLKEGIVEGNAVLVFDGETIGIVASNGSRYLIRLRGIEAPEYRQPFGLESANQLATMVQGMNVVAIVGEKLSIDRYVGAVYLEGEDLSLAQIRRGMAWSSDSGDAGMSKEQKEALKRAEEQARASRVGLWASQDPVSPVSIKCENSVKPLALMNGSTESASQTQNTKAVVPPTPAKSPTTNPSKKYILGPRGGCYYLDAQQKKVYVRKDLCTQP